MACTEALLKWKRENYKNRRGEILSWKRSYYQRKMKDPNYRLYIRAKRNAYYRTAKGKSIDLNYQASPAGRWVRYRYDAKRRGLQFKLTKEEFMSYWQKPCAYCGSAIATIGLDRIDSDRGYEVGNLNPCCAECNVAKSDKTLAQYIDHCKRVAKIN